MRTKGNSDFKEFVKEVVVPCAFFVAVSFASAIVIYLIGTAIIGR